MARKKRESTFENWFWLLVSGAGGVLFAFGLLDVFNSYGASPWWAVGLGAVITFVSLILRKYRTETSVALKSRRK
jgi:uncharacterized membrane protein